MRDELSGTERALYGDVSADRIREVVDGYLRARLATGVAEVIFRSGRIDAVWGVRTDDGREVVVKAHRPPMDLAARAATLAAQRLLVAAGFPCPEPLAGPDPVGDLLLSVETLTGAGAPADVRRPAIRAAVAGGLHGHIELLRGVPGLVEHAGHGPAWCQYQDGPWPPPHVPNFDFATTPDGYAWLDELARAAADQVLATRDGDAAVVGHADWYAGNLRFDHAELVAAFDWELVADDEPVIVGFTAACYTASSTSGPAHSSVADAAAFFTDYDRLRTRPFTPRQQAAAAAAAAWTIAFNARCELCMITGDPGPDAILTSAREHGTEYLALRW